MPKISIITVNLDNADGLQKTMESVRTQNFSDYEYIVIDGGSSDGSRGYIEQYADKLSYWVSEKDNGVYNAMNKGIVKAGGRYLLFLNSGDYFYSNSSLKELVDESEDIDLVYGNMIIDDGSSLRTQTYPSLLDFDYFFSGRSLPHHSTLIKAALFRKVGLYNETYKIVSDWEFFINAVCLYGASYKYIPADISVFMLNGASTLPENIHLYEEERQITYKKYYGAFLNLIESNKAYQRQLRLIQSSRLHSIAEKIINSRIYKFLKN